MSRKSRGKRPSIHSIRAKRYWNDIREISSSRNVPLKDARRVYRIALDIMDVSRGEVSRGDILKLIRREHIRVTPPPVKEEVLPFLFRDMGPQLELFSGKPVDIQLPFFTYTTQALDPAEIPNILRALGDEGEIWFSDPKHLPKYLRDGEVESEAATWDAWRKNRYWRIDVLFLAHMNIDAGTLRVTMK